MIMKVVSVLYVFVLHNDSVLLSIISGDKRPV